MATTRATAKTKPEPAPVIEDQAGDVELVAIVSRNPDGSPRQAPGFKVLLPEGASDAEQAVAWNAGGELPPADRIQWFRVG